MADSNTRYTAIKNQITADVGTTRFATIDSIDRHLTWAAELWAGAHPDGWNWLFDYEEVASQNESFALTSLTDEARPNGIVAVAVKNTATGATGEFIPLEKYPWNNAVQRTDFIRTASVTGDQAWFTEKMTQTTSGSAGSRTLTLQRTIETFPYSFASSTLTYAVTYLRQSPTIATAADADADLLWPSQDDMFIAHLAEIAISHELQQDDMHRRAIALAQIDLDVLLQIYGIPASRLKLPSLKDIQQVAVRS